MCIKALRRACGGCRFGAGFTRGLLLLRDSYRRAYVLDVFKHEDRVLLSVFQLLEEQEGFLIIAQATFDAITLKLHQAK